MTITGTPVPLPPGADLAAYRVVQEALTNTVKHAPGASAQITITYSPDAVTVDVADTGGLPGTAIRPGGGYGLAGLRERLAIYQELSASSSPPPASRTPEQQGDDQGRDGRHNCDVARHRGATRQDGDHRREGFSWRSARRPPMPGMRAVALVVVAARLRFQVAATTNR